MAFMKNLDDIDTLPQFIPIRRGTLKPLGGTLENMFDAKFDKHEGRYSREAGHACRKDFRINARRNYRPWQFSRTCIAI
jgi:hypothetical protein